jgi:hypothetical protein
MTESALSGISAQPHFYWAGPNRDGAGSWPLTHPALFNRLTTSRNHPSGAVKGTSPLPISRRARALYHNRPLAVATSSLDRAMQLAAGTLDLVDLVTRLARENLGSTCARRRPVPALLQQLSCRRSPWSERSAGRWVVGGSLGPAPGPTLDSLDPLGHAHQRVTVDEVPVGVLLDVGRGERNSSPVR